MGIVGLQRDKLMIVEVIVMSHEKKAKKRKGRNDHETIKETSPRRFEHEFANEPMTPVELDRNKIPKKC